MTEAEKNNALHEIGLIVERGHGLSPAYSRLLLDQVGDRCPGCAGAIIRMTDELKALRAEKEALERERDAWQLGFKMKYEGEANAWRRRAEDAERALKTERELNGVLREDWKKSEASLSTLSRQLEEARSGSHTARDGGWCDRKYWKERADERAASLTSMTAEVERLRNGLPQICDAKPRHLFCATLKECPVCQEIASLRSALEAKDEALAALYCQAPGVCELPDKMCFRCAALHPQAGGGAKGGA